LDHISAQYANAKFAVGAQPPPSRQPYLEAAKKQYFEGVGMAYDQYTRFLDAASSSVAQASTMLSTAVYGTPTGPIESMTSVAREWNDAVASRASENFNSLVSKASEQIYGPPTPFTASVLNQAGEYAAQATAAAASHYAALLDVVSELVVGREPDFTESVMSRLSSAYHTFPGQAAASASSLAAEASGAVREAVGDAYASVDSVASKVGSVVRGAVETAKDEL
jgi:hypothetical protein